MNTIETEQWVKTAKKFVESNDNVEDEILGLKLSNKLKGQALERFSALLDEQTSQTDYDWTYISQQMKQNEALKKAQANQKWRNLVFRVGDDISEYIHSLKTLSRMLNRSEEDTLEKLEEGLPHYLLHDVFSDRRDEKPLSEILDNVQYMHERHAANYRNRPSYSRPTRF